MSSSSGFEADSPEVSATPENSDDARALLDKARAGDRAAYGQIVVSTQDRLYNALLRMVGEPEEARELTQETFARGLESIDGFRGESGIYTWLYRIGMNLAVSALRRSQRRRTFSLDGAIADGSASKGSQAAGLDRMVSGEAPSQALERRERGQMVLDALGRLDAEYRAVLVLRDVEGLDYQQVADALGLPLGTLKSRLFRARVALRDELEPYFSQGKRPRPGGAGGGR